MSLQKLIFLVKPIYIYRNFGNFSHRNDRVTKLWSHGHIYNIISAKLKNLMPLNRRYEVITFISKNLYFKETGIRKFDEVMKLVIFRAKYLRQLNRRNISPGFIFLGASLGEIVVLCYVSSLWVSDYR